MIQQKILKIALVGKTKAGKSTLLNQFIGETISIINKNLNYENIFNRYEIILNFLIDTHFYYTFANLVNEFSDFARMPKPIFQNNDICKIINNSMSLLKEIDKNILIKFNFSKSKLLVKCDNEQISRVFLNLIKNSIESIQEKSIKNLNFA